MSQAPTAEELLAQKTAGLHQRLTQPADEAEDPLLAQTGCAAPYTQLEVRPPLLLLRCLRGGQPDWVCLQGEPAVRGCGQRQWDPITHASTPPRRSAWGSTTGFGASARKARMLGGDAAPLLRCCKHCMRAGCPAHAPTPTDSSHPAACTCARPLCPCRGAGPQGLPRQAAAATRGQRQVACRQPSRSTRSRRHACRRCPAARAAASPRSPVGWRHDQPGAGACVVPPHSEGGAALPLHQEGRHHRRHQAPV